VKNPIVIYVEEKNVHVSEINFPAVTICPGLVLATDSIIKLDYDQIIDDLNSGRKSMENFTENQ
jgi:hypothetical protein